MCAYRHVSPPKKSVAVAPDPPLFPHYRSAKGFAPIVAHQKWVGRERSILLQLALRPTGLGLIGKIGLRLFRGGDLILAPLRGALFYESEIL